MNILHFTDEEIELIAHCVECTESEFGLDEEDWELITSIFTKFGRGHIGEVNKRRMEKLFRKGGNR